ncbi:MAG: hypothetical protein LBI37_00505 [Puniceicoccales bacterium]|jgi:hypothetical protein|nr:hypothetical protein [Puniceicoccales bacterium]
MLLALDPVIFFLTVIFLLWPSLADCAVSGVPMVRFLLPIFDEDGNKVLEFSGERADLMSDNDVRIFSASMQTVVLEGSNSMELSVAADEADVSIKDEAAVGNGMIVINGSGFSVIGNDWEFVGNSDKKFIISSGAQVFFDKYQNEIL